MPTAKKGRKVKIQKNGFLAVRPSRVQYTERQRLYHHEENELDTPPLASSSSSTTPSDIDSRSPSLLPVDYSIKEPTLSKDTMDHVNPFLVPPGAYPAELLFHPMAHQMPMLFDQKVKPTKAKKKVETRVTFSDTASIISDTTPTESTQSSSEESDETETERRARAARERAGKKATPAATQRQKPSQSTQQAPQSRAVQVRRRRPSGDGIHSARTTSSKHRHHRQQQQQQQQQTEEEEDDLFARISSAIPDLSLLLSKYKDANGEISLRDSLRKRVEAQSVEMLKNKEDTINMLMAQLDDQAKAHADDLSQLHHRVTALEEQNSELVGLVEEAKAKIKVAELRLKAAEDAERKMAKHNEQLLEERKVLAKKTSEEVDKALSRQRDLMKEEFMKQKGAMKVARKEAEAQAAKMREDLESEFKKRKADFEAKMKKDKEDTEASFQKKKAEFQETVNKEKEAIQKEKEEVATKLSEVEKQLEAMGKTDEEVREKVEVEFQTKLAEEQKKHDQETADLREFYNNYLADQMKGFVTLQEALNRNLMEENESLKMSLYSATKPADAENTPPPSES